MEAMKFIDEYRRSAEVEKWANAIGRITTQPWSIMEVCGGQTHSILKFGVDTFLPDQVEFIHGPGCPVCVTPVEMIDKAIEIARRPNVVLCSFGDMLRVPGSHQSLLTVKAEGHDVRLLYSPLDAVELAKQTLTVKWFSLQLVLRQQLLRTQWPFTKLPGSD